VAAAVALSLATAAGVLFVAATSIRRTSSILRGGGVKLWLSNLAVVLTACDSETGGLPPF
ncbi:MAG: hypothetical protein HOC72_17080, partial [Rhodospirillaceae bacterium]|nr:hypothetical protein [Rhodospirillaceae bacterium]